MPSQTVAIVSGHRSPFAGAARSRREIRCDSEENLTGDPTARIIAIALRRLAERGFSARDTQAIASPIVRPPGRRARHRMPEPAQPQNLNR
jgi:hypothetical protein